MPSKKLEAAVARVVSYGRHNQVCVHRHALGMDQPIVALFNTTSYIGTSSGSKTYLVVSPFGGDLSYLRPTIPCKGHFNCLIVVDFPKVDICNRIFLGTRVLFDHDVFQRN